MNNKVVAMITTYNPEIYLLAKNIQAVKLQVDKLIIYENASTNRDEIVELCKQNGADIVLNETNEGVAGPLHDGIDYAIQNGYKYILTLDQDSIVSENMVEVLLKTIILDRSLAIVGATPINPDIKVRKRAITERYVSNVITSGALADVQKVKNVGNYIKEMFIDAVDDEICFRLRTYGYKIAQSEVTFTHYVGKPKAHRFLFKTYHSMNYSPIRYYYIWRNFNFLFLMYKKEKKDIKTRKNTLTKNCFKVILSEKDKYSKFLAMRKGKKDAKKFYNQIKEEYNL